MIGPVHRHFYPPGLCQLVNRVQSAFGQRPVPLQTGFGSVPLMDPRWSMRDSCKEAILLEHHLSVQDRRCPDCIRKHFLAFEAYLEEALRLDPDPELADYLRRAIPHVQWCARSWSMGMPPEQVAHAIRDLRKFLVKWCFNAVQSADVRAL